MRGRELLAGVEDLPYDPRSVTVADEDVLGLLDPVVAEWWVERFGAAVPENGGFFTRPQRDAIPHIHDGTNVLVCAPTGSGKTLASFTAILDDLFGRDREGRLENSVYCLYVSPLRSLANDVHRNLEGPLDGIAARLADRGVETDVRHAIRHGDTDEGARRRMLERTPHVLNTTPETLAILLNSPSFREKLRAVEYVVVDEIHSLAANKRGTHLSVSLERLEALADSSPTRIGCSATIEPLDTVAEFLVGSDSVETSGGRKGDTSAQTTPDEEDTSAQTTPDHTPRDYELVDARFERDYDLALECPTEDLIQTPREVVRERFYERLDELIQSHTNTLVFANSRSGAERVLHTLRERGDRYDETNSACHHGSLSKERREGVEERLKAGELAAVTTSTSLELGIDMPHLDLVVQIGSPKSAATLLQRVGRAGHRPGRTVEGRILVLDRDELLECAAMLARAEEGFVDRVFVPENALDVAAQHVYGMAIADVRPEAEVRETIGRAFPYRELSDEAWERLLRYLTADYEGLTERNVYPKIWRDANDPPDGEHHYPEYPVGEPLVGKRGRLARVVYFTNVGTIPDSFSCGVFVRGTDERVGSLDESYLDTLATGDVFVLGGDRFEYRYRRGSKVYVDRTDDRPTVPSWFSERLPLSYDLGRERLDFQHDLLARHATGGVPAVRDWLRQYTLDENSVRAVARLLDEQVRYAGSESVSTTDRLAVEEVRDREDYRRRYHVHSGYGRRFNDGLSRLVAHHCSRRTGATVKRTVTDGGFTLSVPLNRKVELGAVLSNLDPTAVRPDLREALEGSDLLERYFRIVATRSLMVLKRYRGYERSAAEQQLSSEMLLSLAHDLEEFAVLEETYREILEDRLHAPRIEAVLRRLERGDLTVVSRELPSPSPLAFGLATLSASDVVLTGDEREATREFQRRVRERIDDADPDR